VTKLNIGCGKYPLAGYTNVDLLGPADIIGDFWQIIYPVLDAWDEVRADHWLEHQPIAKTGQALSRMKDWLKPGGLLRIEVPDMDLVLQGVTGPVSLMWAIYGSQEHEGAFHKSGFTAKSLRNLIRATGFHDVNVEAFLSDHPMRKGFPCLLATARK
jgi:predicted SAM-dependent methyltransferase